MKPGVLQRYRDYLPVSDATPIFTLGEGDTPLVRSHSIEAEIGCGALYFKLEGCNPTGSFKDRGMVVAVAKALEDGAESLICASTGNTSASAAAYGARCGMTTVVAVPKKHVARGKLAQAAAYGARIVLIDGNFDDALRLVRAAAHKHSCALVNSVNPHRLEGQKTAAFEIVEELEDSPDYLFIPVGNAGNITAYWKGFVESRGHSWSSRVPRMMGVQAEGAAPIVRGEPVAEPRSVASAIRVGNPASWSGAVSARDESDGAIDAVTDDEILEGYARLAREEGIFGEPASAASVAGLLKQHRIGLDLAGKTVVCVITGNGLKDPDTAVELDSGAEELPAEASDLEKALALA